MKSQGRKTSYRMICKIIWIFCKDIIELCQNQTSSQWLKLLYHVSISEWDSSNNNITVISSSNQGLNQFNCITSFRAKTWTKWFSHYHSLICKMYNKISGYNMSLWTLTGSNKFNPDSFRIDLLKCHKWITSSAVTYLVYQTSNK